MRLTGLGLYVELAEIPKHEYLIGTCLAAFTELDQTTLADSSDFCEVEKEEPLPEKHDSAEFEFNLKSQEIAKQLINGYAKVLAASYLTAERLGGLLLELILEQLGITWFLMYFISFFSLVDLYRKFYVSLQIQRRIQDTLERGKTIKESVAKSAVGKPLVEQGELLLSTIRDIADQTEKMIVT